MTSQITILASLVLLCLRSVASLASPRDLSPEAAVRDAKRDIKVGHMRIFMAGTEYGYEAGLERRDVPLVRRLPRDYNLPMGCTDPQASAAITYATAYNRAIIQHFRRANHTDFHTVSSNQTMQRTPTRCSLHTFHD